MSDIEDIQSVLDNSVHEELLEVAPVVFGMELRPVTLASIALLKQIKSPLIEGVPFAEIENIVIDACMFLKLQSCTLKEAQKLAFGNREELMGSALELAESIDPSDLDNVLNSVVSMLTKSTSTKVSVVNKDSSDDVSEPTSGN